jgi:hypothetical protein
LFTVFHAEETAERIAGSRAVIVLGRGVSSLPIVVTAELKLLSMVLKSDIA